MESNLTKANITAKRIIITLGVVTFALILFYIILNWNLDWKLIKDELRTKDNPFYLVNIVIFIGALATAAFTWWRNSISKQQVEVAQGQMEEQIRQTENAQRQIALQEDTRLDSLYTKGVELLSEKNDLLMRNEVSIF